MAQTVAVASHGGDCVWAAFLFVGSTLLLLLVSCYVVLNSMMMRIVLVVGMML